MQGLPTHNVRIGPSLWILTSAGVLELVCYGANRYYSSALYNAEFIKQLMEDSDSDAEDEDVDDLFDGKINTK